MRREEAALTERGGPIDRGRGRAPARVASSAALLGLIVLVALGTRAGHGGGGRLAQRHVPNAVSNDLLTILVLAYVLGLVGVAVLFLKAKERWQPVRSSWIKKLVTAMILFALIGLLGAEIAGRRIHHHGQHGPAAQSSGKGHAPARKAPTIPPSAARAHFDWPIAVGLLGLLFIGGVLYALRGRQTASDLRAPSEQPDLLVELSAVVSESIDDLRADPDPRRAVIAAYARMEGVLARHGYERRPAETPFEYLSRILRELRVRGRAVQELTELFELAKFSIHAIDTEMKERALAAFLSVRDDLRQPLPA